jgi:hypothetical protein
MHTNRYAQPTSTTYAAAAPARQDFYAALATQLERPAPRRNTMVMTLERSSIAQDAAQAAVCDLIAAAGPLTATDIAGGLDVDFATAAGYVQSLAASGALREDEFGRYSLSGAYARHAF